MSLTFGEAKKILAKFQGKGGKQPTNSQLHDFVIKVLQYMMITGSHGSERKFTFYAANGFLTAPEELEVPLKVQIDGRVGNVGNKWFEFHSGSDLQNCYQASDALLEEPNPYFTAYDVPAEGANVGVQGMAEEDADAHIIIAGTDSTGREIFTNHKGGEIAGEYLAIRKGVITWSNVRFANITGVYKTRTNGYTPLYWRTSATVKGFLADYSPVDEAPTYRRFKLNIPNCPNLARVSVLGRIRLKSAYADSDRIPFDNLYSIEVAGQQVNAQFNKNLADAQQSDQFLAELINREATYKKVSNGNPLDVFHATSGGTIKGIA